MTVKNILKLASQVDRALASALKYGIFEIRNNRYRVRDDVVDDEDTVYWKVQRKREQTPYRTEEAARKCFLLKLTSLCQLWVNLIVSYRMRPQGL